MIDEHEKNLVVNADDFGYSRGINRGILEAHERGIVTSTSVMVRFPAAEEAIHAARRFPSLGFGLHVDLGEWVYQAGAWVPLYQVLSEAEAQSHQAVAAEVERQLHAFRTLLGRDPTHLDSHQHAHRMEPLKSILLEWSHRLKIPLRHFDRRIRYRGDFYGQLLKGEPYPQATTAAALVDVIRSLPSGVTELACHPGIGCDHHSAYGPEREAEVRSLCDATVREAICEQSVRLVSFAALQTGSP